MSDDASDLRRLAEATERAALAQQIAALITAVHTKDVGLRLAQVTEVERQIAVCLRRLGEMTP